MFLKLFIKTRKKQLQPLLSKCAVSHVTQLSTGLGGDSDLTESCLSLIVEQCTPRPRRGPGTFSISGIVYFV